MLRLLAAGIALAALFLVGDGLTRDARAEPALTRSNSVLPPPRTIVLCRCRPSRPSLHPLELRRLATLPRCR